MSEYKKNSLSLLGVVSLGTGVMIGAAIFALMGQVAELSGKAFPLALLGGAVIAAFSAYSYVKMSASYPSAGGIAMYLKKAYGKTVLTASAALLMAFAMVINQSLVARTFGSYTMQLFQNGNTSFWAPALGVVLLVIVFMINIAGNKIIQKTSLTMAIIKIGGIALFAVGGLWVANFSSIELFNSKPTADFSTIDYLSAFALSVLAYAGFTTITNSGEELKKPKKNLGRAIIISLSICLLIYMMVALAVTSNLSVDRIIEAKDYALAEAARPAFGKYGLWFTVGIAIIATVSGLLANVFAVSRMTAMLTKMKLIPHSHFGMPGRIQKHMLVYTVVIAIVLTVLFDLTRIASIGIIMYLLMDIIFQWGVLFRLRKDINANGLIVFLALFFNGSVLLSFIIVKLKNDPLIAIVAVGLSVLIFGGEWLFLHKTQPENSNNKN